MYEVLIAIFRYQLNIDEINNLSNHPDEPIPLFLNY